MQHAAGVIPVRRCETAIQVVKDENAKMGVLDDVVVIGVRASLASAQDIKRDKVEIVDSVVADDITKLPDFSITDALQRIASDRGSARVSPFAVSRKWKRRTMAATCSRPVRCAITSSPMGVGALPIDAKACGWLDANAQQPRMAA
jgi:hypothetical protein